LKVDSLLIQYLQQQKKLQLPGIGLFTYKETVTTPDTDSKTKTDAGAISFLFKPGVAHDDAFIDYIKQQTGKMKPLAESDLDAYIMGALQFLNIGKPFYIEGIGTISKGSDGNFRFSQGEMTEGRPDDIAEKHRENRKKSVFAGEQELKKGDGRNLNKMLVALGLIGTAALVIGGGYLLYHKNTRNSDTEQNSAVVTSDTTASAQKAITDSTAVPLKTDSTAPGQNTVNPNTAARSFKFILETTNKNTALHRLSLLKPKVQVQTKDSLRYQLYITLTRRATDTARVRDSLKNWYWGERHDRKVTIEQ
jgi:hypothetical protein